ncbi:MAG: hypothetical protein ACTSO2_14050 [Promethearchaeota archaeon]
MGKSSKRWSPPKATTTSLSLFILILGIALGIGGYLNQYPSDLVPIAMDTNQLFIIIGLILPFISWLVLYLGVTTKAL